MLISNSYTGKATFTTLEQNDLIQTYIKKKNRCKAVINHYRNAGLCGKSVTIQALDRMYRKYDTILKKLRGI